MSGRSVASVGIVGAGVMAEAMIAGLLADRAVKPGRLVASHPRRDRRAALAERYGVRMVSRNREAAAGADTLVLAVKPQVLPAAMRDLASVLAPNQVVLSIVAGANLATLARGLGHPAVA